MHLKKPLPAAIALLLATLASSAHAAAQDAPAAPPAPDAPVEATELDRVRVTGTNLAGLALEEAQPVVIIDAAQIAESGAQTLTEVLADLSQAGGGTGNFNTFASGSLQADAPAGTAGVSLRGLGTAATLTLVNGRRIATSSFANGSENFVDVNMIPLAAVERVEILTTGASAIYGADAVAGVVNFILREDFDGLRISGSYGDSEAGSDESRSNANLAWGRTGERGRALLILDAYRRNALYDRDRAETAVEPRPSEQGVFASFNDLFALPGDLVEAGCPDAQRFDGRPGFPEGRFGAFCSLNRNQYTATDPESRRLGALGSFGWSFDSGLEWFADVALQRNVSRADAAPAPWSEEAIAFDHPDMPAELRARLLAGGADPGFPVFGWGRFPDARTIEVTSTSWRVLQGLRGSVGDWHWESALNLSESQSEQEAVAGIYNVARFRAGLLGELCADGRTTCSPGAGGLWYNPFGGQADNDAAVLALVRERVPRDGDASLYAWDAKLDGTWGAIGDRDVQWAFGTEVRREETTDRPSPLATIDANGEVPVYGFGSTRVDAARTSQALFAEVLLPLASTLDLRLAARYDHFSDFGGDLNPAASVRWQPSDAVLVRGGWNSSFRAPSLAQVGAGVSLGSGALPCSPGSEFFSTWCDGFAGDDAYLTEIYGNPDLEAETAKAWYLGTVFSLGAGTTLSLDWWDFRHRNLVDIDDLELFRRALLDPSLVAAEGDLGPGQIGIETRNGTIGSPIEQVNLELINIGRQETSGLDVAFQHDRAFAGGDLRLWVDGTWTRTFKRQESCDPNGSDARRGTGPCVDGQRLVERTGEFRYPELLASAGVRWARGDWSTRLWANHTDGYYDDDQRAGVPAGRRIPSWTILSLAVTWDVTDDQHVTLGVRNLADRDAPIALGSAANVDLFNHDTEGRFYTVSYGLRF